MPKHQGMAKARKAQQEMMEQMGLMVKMEQMDKMAYKVPWEQLAHKDRQEMME